MCTEARKLLKIAWKRTRKRFERPGKDPRNRKSTKNQQKTAKSAKNKQSENTQNYFDNRSHKQPKSRKSAQKQEKASKTREGTRSRSQSSKKCKIEKNGQKSRKSMKIQEKSPRGSRFAKITSSARRFASPRQGPSGDSSKLAAPGKATGGTKSSKAFKYLVNPCKINEISSKSRKSLAKVKKIEESGRVAYRGPGSVTNSSINHRKCLVITQQKVLSRRRL